MGENILSNANSLGIEEHILHQCDVRLISALKTLNLLVPCKTEKRDMEERTAFAILISSNGERFVPAFTNPIELVKWPFQMDKATLQPFASLKSLVEASPQYFSGILVNPFGEKLILRQAQIKRTDADTEGLYLELNERGGKMRLMRPYRGMPELENSLKALFLQHKEVYSAYLVMVSETETTIPKPILIIDYDGDGTPLLEEIDGIIGRCYPDGGDYKITKATYSMMNIASKISEPLYTKPVN